METESAADKEEQKMERRRKNRDKSRKAKHCYSDTLHTEHTLKAQLYVSKSNAEREETKSEDSDRDRGNDRKKNEDTGKRERTREEGTTEMKVT